MDRFVGGRRWILANTVGTQVDLSSVLTCLNVDCIWRRYRYACEWRLVQKQASKANRTHESSDAKPHHHFAFMLFFKPSLHLRASTMTVNRIFQDSVLVNCRRRISSRKIKEMPFSLANGTVPQNENLDSFRRNSLTASPNR